MTKRRWHGEVIKVVNPRFTPGSPEHDEYKNRQKKYYYDTAEIQRQKARDRVQRKRERNQQFLVNQINGKSCECCGIDDIRVLTYDHLDEYDKFANIADLVSRGSPIEKLQREIEKCRILCHNCHMIHTMSNHQSGWYKDKLKPITNEEFFEKYKEFLS